MKPHRADRGVGRGRIDHWSANRPAADQWEGQVNRDIRITRKEGSPKRRTGKSVIQERCSQRADAPHRERPLTRRAGAGSSGSSSVPKRNGGDMTMRKLYRVASILVLASVALWGQVQPSQAQVVPVPIPGGDIIAPFTIAPG